MKSFSIFRIHPLLRFVPFSDEKLAEITEDSDFVSFLESYSLPFGDDEFRLFKDYIYERDVVTISDKVLKSQNFIRVESTVIGAIKHTFAYCRLLATLASRDDLMALHIPHFLESEDDLNVTFPLLGGQRYKNVDQVLRSVIELAVKHAYFAIENRISSEAHKTKSISITRERNGLVKALVNNGLLTRSEGGSIVALYRRLSIAVHTGTPYLSYPEAPANQEALFLQSILNMRDTSVACIHIVLNMMRVDLNNMIHRDRERDALAASQSKIRRI